MRKTIKINEIIFSKIKFRYDFFSDASIHDRLRHNKLFIDSFYPYSIGRKIINPDSDVRLYPANDGFAISERVAEDMSARQLHISELITMLGYTKTDISKLLQSVKVKELNIVLVGLGGSGSNFLHWLYEMAEWTGKTEIFNMMFLFDKDDFDIPNMLRIPFIPQFDEDESPSKVNCVPTKFNMLGKRVERYEEFLTEETLSNDIFTGNHDKTIVYGAPDINTREFLSANPITFIAGTHRDSTVSMVENPAVDNDLMMETYGKINLSKFFMNHLMLTIEFLTYLSNRAVPFGSTLEQTILISNFESKFQSEMINGFKAGSKKLFISDELWVGLENLEIPGANNE